MQALTPLEEKADGITLHRESGSHQGTRCILNGCRTIAHADWYIVQSGIDEDGLRLCLLDSKASCHRGLIEVVHSFCHRLAGFIIIESQQLVRLNLMGNTSDGSGQTHLLGVEVCLCSIAE